MIKRLWWKLAPLIKRNPRKSLAVYLTTGLIVTFCFIKFVLGKTPPGEEFLIPLMGTLFVVGWPLIIVGWGMQYLGVIIQWLMF